MRGKEEAEGKPEDGEAGAACRGNGGRLGPRLLVGGRTVKPFSEQESRALDFLPTPWRKLRPRAWGWG